MSGIDELKKLVTERKEVPPAPIDWEKEKNAWLSEVQNFIAQVKTWLADFVEKQQIVLKEEEISIFEERLGDYKTIKLNILIGSQRVVLKPIGTLLIGAKGRFDLIGPAGEFTFVLVDKNSPGVQVRIIWDADPQKAEKEKFEPPTVREWAWRIATPPPRVKFLELNQESFSDCLVKSVKG